MNPMSAFHKMKGLKISKSMWEENQNDPYLWKTEEEREGGGDKRKDHRYINHNKYSSQKETLQIKK